MENKTSPQIEEPLRQSVEEVQQPSRRAFLAFAVAASGAAALWYLPRPFASASAAERSADVPSTVTVVKFSSAGKNLGKETVPHIMKSHAEWKSQAIPVGDVFAHAHDELTGVAILSVDLLKKGVGRRATGASLGREEFHEDRTMPRLRVIPVQVSRWLRRESNDADRKSRGYA